MLTKLESEVISRYWEDIADAIVASVPPLAEVTDTALNELLKGLLEDRMQAWILCDIIEDRTVVYALVITTIWRDPGLDTKNLLIYALYGYSTIQESMWKAGLETLRKYARGIGCKAIVGLTSVPRIREVVEQLGGDTSISLITLAV